MNNSIFQNDGTAQGVAKQRLIETLATPGKRIINDPYAERFVFGAGLIKLMGHAVSVWLTQKLAPGFHEHLICRTRFIDDQVQKSVAIGAEQYVILGAGYDMRAYRLALPSALKIYEVDQPKVQARKCSKLPKRLPNSENISHISIEFNHQSLSKRLLAAGFNQNNFTIFTIEGLSQYISKKAFISIINELAILTENTNTILVISYVDEHLNTKPESCFGMGYPNAAKRAELIKGLAAKAGEPWISFYSADEIEKILSHNGFTVYEDTTLESLNSIYFSPVDRTVPTRSIMNLEHFILAKSIKH